MLILFYCSFYSNFIARLAALALGPSSGPYPRGGLGGSAEKLIFFLWKVNFLWSYNLKFQIFCPCSAYRHPRRMFSINCYYFQAKSYEFSSKIPKLFERAFGARFYYYLSGIITPQKNTNFFHFFTLFDIFFDKKFRACPPPVRNFWVRAWPSYLWHGPSSAPPCAGEFGRVIRNIRHHSIYPYGHLNCF